MPGAWLCAKPGPAIDARHVYLCKAALSHFCLAYVLELGSSRQQAQQHAVGRLGADLYFDQVCPFRKHVEGLLFQDAALISEAASGKWDTWVMAKTQNRKYGNKSRSEV